MTDGLELLGPLRPLVGVWEGDQGVDLAPAADRAGAATTRFRERMTFEPVGQINNHEQILFGVRYATVAWRIGEPDACELELEANLGSETYGICSNRFLDREFKTVRYELKVTIHDLNSFSYEEDTQIEMGGQRSLFHHRDRNTLRRVG